MTDNTYSGTLKFKDVDFVFVLDGSELVLIPPNERKNDIMWVCDTFWIDETHINDTDPSKGYKQVHKRGLSRQRPCV